MVQSMSRKANCWDNAPIESFFAMLKTECFYNAGKLTVDELMKQIDDYMDYYNRERCSLKLKKLSPVAYRTQLALFFTLVCSIVSFTQLIGTVVTQSSPKADNVIFFTIFPIGVLFDRVNNILIIRQLRFIIFYKLLWDIYFLKSSNSFKRTSCTLS